MTRTPDSTDGDLRDGLLERLGGGADLSPARREALVDRIAADRSPAPARRRRGAWWLAAAAAAAAVVAAAVLWPAEPEPIPPTALFGDLLGPLPTLSAPASDPDEGDRPAVPTSDALAVVWGDLADPLAIVSRAVEAPRAILSDEPTGPAPAGGSDETKEN
jgi:hypothetical protein